MITVEIGLRGVGESRVYGSLLILSKGLECQVFPLGYWPFLCGVTFPAGLLCQVLPTCFFYDSVVHVEMTVNVCVGYIGWKPHARWEQQAQHNHQEQQSTMNSIVNREAIERINRTR